MVKLSFTITPEQMAKEAAAENDRQSQIAHIHADALQLCAKESLSRDDIHLLLDACLDLAELARQAPSSRPWNDEPEAPVKEAGRRIGQTLMTAALGWTEDPHEWEREICVPQADIPWALQYWRAHLVARLGRSPHLLPPLMMNTLVGALAVLDDGTGKESPIFKRTKKGGRGSDPRQARLSEITMLGWIEYEEALKRPVHKSRQRVAAAVGLSPGAIEKWLPAQRELRGADTVAQWLSEAREDALSGRPFVTDETWTVESEGKRWLRAKGQE